MQTYIATYSVVFGTERGSYGGETKHRFKARDLDDASAEAETFRKAHHGRETSGKGYFTIEYWDTKSVEEQSKKARV